MKALLIATGFLLFTQTLWAVSQPDWNVTPGVLCTPQDADFQGFDYPEKIARCLRAVGDDEKTQIANNYGQIPESEWHNYEFDHLIPLCAGGSDALGNLWPQPILEAKKKDILELDICNAMKAGTMTQAQAIVKVHDWYQQNVAIESVPLTIQRFLQVTPNIYRGSRPAASDLVQLKSQYKIKTVVDVEDDKTAIAQEKTETKTDGLNFLLTAINAYTTPTDAEINGVLAQLQDPANFPIYLHCHYGEDRTGLVIGLYRVTVQGWTPAQAYQEMLANGFHTILIGLDNYFRQRTGYTGN